MAGHKVVPEIYTLKIDDQNVVNDNVNHTTPVGFNKTGFFKCCKCPQRSKIVVKQNQNEQQSKRKVFEIYRFADKYDICLMLVGTIAALATGATVPLLMYLYQNVVNSFVNIGNTQVLNDSQSHSIPECFNISSTAIADPFETINSIIKWYAIIGCFSLLLFATAYACWLTTAERQVRRMRFILFRNMMYQEFSWFETLKPGQLQSHLIEDLNTIREGMGFTVVDLLCTNASSTGSLIFAFYIGWKLTLIFLSMTPVIVTAFIITKRIGTKYTEKEKCAYNDSNAIIKECLTAIKTVTAYGGQSKELAKYEKCLMQGKQAGIKKGLFTGISQAFISITLYSSFALVFWCGLFLVRTECTNYKAGHVVVIFVACLTSTLGLTKLQPIIQALTDSSISKDRVLTLIEQKSKINASENEGKKPVLSNVSRDIIFDNVEFSYESRKIPVLKNINLVIPAGKVTAIIGSSGSGKSTIFKLIQRLCDPTKGRILYGNDDIQTLDLKMYRSTIAHVDQEPQLFLGTIEDNIKFGNLDATEVDIWQACRTAVAYDFIQRFQEKLQTASQLSGGEKQRVAIARALVSKATILLLDEATSALDNESEQAFVEALHNVKTTLGLTIVVIAHRLTTVRRADNIVCLEHGHGIVEQGTHEELIQKNGLYQQFYMTQQTIKTVAVRNEEPSKPTTERSDITLQIETPNDVDQESIVNNNSKMPKFLTEILRINRAEWIYLCSGCLASLIYGGVIPGFSLLFAELFELFVEPDYQKQEIQARNYSIIIFFIGVFGGICQLIFTSTFAKSGEELAAKLRRMSFKTILSQEIAWFNRKENNIYILINRLYTDINSLKGLSGTNIGIFFNAMGALLTASVIAFRISPKLTLVILSFAPVVIFTSILLQRLESLTQTRNIDKNKTKSISHVELGNKYASQAIDNFRTVVSFCREDYFIEKYEQEFNYEFRQSKYKILLISLGNAIGNSVMFFIHAAAFSYGSNLVKENEISFVDVFRVFSVVTFAAMSIGRTMALVPSYSKAKKASLEIIKLNNQSKTTGGDDSRATIPIQLTGKIEFQNVWFKYTDETYVLKNINLICNGNEMIALVGQSGSGKSTLVSLIQRFYSPTSGQILLDGNDIKDLNIDWLRSKCSYVEQEPILFNMTIRENICYGVEDVSQEQIDEAAKKANIYDKIQSLPDGYDTQCGSKEASQLAIGEKQRVALARAFIRQPRILLLDEPTAALDAHSAKIVQNIINTLNPMPTCINVTHRLSTLDQNNSTAQIAVFQYGQIYEQGTYNELMTSEGRIFQQLVMQQQTFSN